MFPVTCDVKQKWEIYMLFTCLMSDVLQVINGHDSNVEESKSLLMVRNKRLMAMTVLSGLKHNLSSSCYRPQMCSLMLSPCISHSLSEQHKPEANP